MAPSFLASRVTRIKASPSTQARARARALGAQGLDIVDFTVGEPDFATPSHIVAAAHRAMLAGETKYPPMTGTSALREAVCQKLSRENGLNCDSGQVVIGSGAKHVIYSALTATVESGDEVIVPAPYWVSYPDMVLVNSGEPVIVPCSPASGFKLTPEALEQAITPRTKWLILNSPNNPSGAVYSRRELTELVAVLARHPQVWLMMDDIYEHFNYSGQEIVSPLRIDPSLFERTLVVNGVSKAYAMTGWRIGFGAGPQHLVKAIGTLLSQSTGGACSISQAASVEALNGPQECVGAAARLFLNRRDRMFEMLAAIPGLDCVAPQGAFYVFPRCAGLIGKSTSAGRLLRSDADVADYLLEQAGVAVVSGASYGCSPHLRFSFATDGALIEEGCRRVHAACLALQ